MMVNRTFVQGDTTVEVDKAKGKALVQKGYAVEVDAPHVEVVKAETPKAKATAKNDTKDKAD
jgi:hypothetical protein